MPIDPSIPLQIKPVQIDPIGTLGKLYSLRHAQQVSQGQELENKQRALELQGKTDDAADEAAIDAELKNVDPNDPQGLHAAGERLRKSGHGRAAAKFNAGLLKAQRDSVAAEGVQIDTIRKAHEFQADVLGGVDGPEKYKMARSLMRLAAERQGPEALAAFDKQVPEEYDPAWVENMRSVLLTTTQRSTAAQRSQEEQHWLLEHGLPDENGNIDPKAIEVGASVLGNQLVHATSEQDWQQMFKAFAQHNHPAITEAVFQRFAKSYSPKAAKAAGDQTLTEKDRQTLGFEAARVKNEGRRIDEAADARKEREKDREEARKDRETAREEARKDRRRAAGYSNEFTQHNKGYEADVAKWRAGDRLGEPPAYRPFKSPDEYNAQQDVLDEAAKAQGPPTPLPAGVPPIGPAAPVASPGRAMPLGPPAAAQPPPVVGAPPVAPASPVRPPVAGGAPPPGPAAPPRPAPAQAPAAPAAAAPVAPPAKPAAAAGQPTAAGDKPPKGQIRIRAVSPTDVRVQLDDGSWLTFKSQAAADTFLKKAGYSDIK